MTPTIAEMTLTLYGYIIERLPPTPSRFHYIFNLRDLSRIYEGLTISTPDKFKTVNQMIRLWRNECLRIFYDRLINDKDKDIFTVNKMALNTIWSMQEFRCAQQFNITIKAVAKETDVQNKICHLKVIYLRCKSLLLLVSHLFS